MYRAEQCVPGRTLFIFYDEKVMYHKDGGDLFEVLVSFKDFYAVKLLVLLKETGNLIEDGII